VVAPVLKPQVANFKKAPERYGIKSQQEKLFNRPGQQGVTLQPEIKTVQI
jgi:hypothetical protein